MLATMKHTHTHAHTQVPARLGGRGDTCDIHGVAAGSVTSCTVNISSSLLFPASSAIASQTIWGEQKETLSGFRPSGG